MKFVAFAAVSVLLLGVASAELESARFSVASKALIQISRDQCEQPSKGGATTITADNLKWSSAHVSPVEMCLKLADAFVATPLQPCKDDQTRYLKFDLKITSGEDSFTVSHKILDEATGTIPAEVCHTFTPCDIYDAILEKSSDLEAATIAGSAEILGYQSSEDVVQANVVMRFLNVIVSEQGAMDESVDVEFGGSVAVIRENAACGITHTCSASVTPEETFTNKSEEAAYLKEGDKVASCDVKEGTQIHYSLFSLDTGSAVCSAPDCKVTVSVLTTEGVSTPPPSSTNQSTTTSNAVKASMGAAFLAVLFSI